MDETRMAELRATLEADGGMLSNSRLRTLGFGDADLAAAEAAGVVTVTGPGALETVFLLAAGSP